MFFNALAAITVVLGLLILYVGLRMLIHRGWMLGWLRGMAGTVFVFIALGFCLVAADLYGYKQLTLDESIATISFEQVGPQAFVAKLVLTDEGEEKQFELKGDQWQLDARIIRWHGFVRSVGGKPGYRLDRISGRYFSLEDERSAERTVYGLDENRSAFDLWSWLHKNDEFMPWVDAVYGSATFVPMADGALFEVALSPSGLSARPLNASAEKAVNRWR